MVRPSKLTLELTEKICKHIVEGNYPGVAAEIEGVSERTFYRWMSKGQKSKTQSGKFWQFWQSIKRAERFAEAAHILNIKRAAAAGKWQASAWWLERKFPDRWGHREKLEHTGQINGNFKVEMSLDDRIREYERRFRAAAEGDNSSDGV